MSSAGVPGAQRARRWKSIVDGSDLAIISGDPEGRIESWNPAAERIFGYNADEMIGDFVARIVPIDRRDEFGEVLARVLSGEAVAGLETQRVRKDGHVIDVLINVFPLRDQQGAVSGVAGLVRDVTYRTRLQERLRSLVSELVLTQEHERRRLAEALHDCLGQSLSLARIKLAQLEQGSSGSPSARTVHDVRSIIDEALKAVQSMTFDLCPPGLHDLGFVQATRWLADEMQSRFGLTVSVDVDGCERPLDERIQIIVFRSLRELLINVAKHAGSATAAVTVDIGPADLTVVVSDSGAGFELDEAQPSDHQPESFGLFSVRQHLVELGGQMEIETAPGMGTRVVLTAPLAATAGSTVEGAPT